jgi:hypothetical protein
MLSKKLLIAFLTPSSFDCAEAIKVNNVKMSVRPFMWLILRKYGLFFDM